MAKGQLRKPKEARKQKTTDKKKELPRYMRTGELSQVPKSAASDLSKKK
jgi:hypothetical protein